VALGKRTKAGFEVVAMPPEIMTPPTGMWPEFTPWRR
jgi:hypothetical protein